MIRWTIRLALACLTASLAIEFARFTGERWRRTSRLVWTVGCALIWLHIAAAFHFHHHGNFAHAADETSQRTAEVLGWSWGGEIYFNFAFAVAWTADVVWQWLAPQSRCGRAAVLVAMIQAFLVFIAMNATIVFEDGVVRAAGIAATVFLASVFLVAAVARRGAKPS